jgi:hypothetical protein
MKCKHCGSPDVRRLSVIVEEGTVTEHFDAESKPVWNTKPFGPQGKHKIKGTRTVRTALARKYAPPDNPEQTMQVLAALPSAFIALYLGFKVGVLLSSLIAGLVVFLVTCVTGPFFFTSAWKKHMGGQAKIAAYQLRLQEWNHSWHCTRCGEVTSDFNGLSGGTGYES